MSKRKSTSEKRKANWTQEHCDIVLQAAAEGLSGRAIASTFNLPNRTEQEILTKCHNMRKTIATERDLVLAEMKDPTELCSEGRSKIFYSTCSL